MNASSFFNKALLGKTVKMAFAKLDPRLQFRNGVLFAVYLASFLVFYLFLWDWIHGRFNVFSLELLLCFLATLFLANFSEALAENFAKKRVADLRNTKADLDAFIVRDHKEEKVPALTLKHGDLVICRAGDIIPADGEVVEGIASVDESAITGESAPVIRESGDDRSAVTEGTRVVSDQIMIRITAESGKSFIDRMISLVESNKRKKTPNEIALNLFLTGFSLLFFLTIFSLKFFMDFAHGGGQNQILFLTALFISLIPTSASALFSTVGIAAMDRVIRRNVVAKSGRAVETSGDIDLLILDKTGTITLGNRIASDFIPAPGVAEQELGQIAQLASLSDETPEGRSIVVLAKKKFDLRGEHLDATKTRFIPFSPQTRLSGIDLLDQEGQIYRKVRKGATDAILPYLEEVGGRFPDEVAENIESITKKGGTPLLVCDNKRLVGIVLLKDVVKGGLPERFAALRAMGIRTLMVTGDNSSTAAAIAAEAGVDDFIAEATPEMKWERIRAEQREGRHVAMAGDGTNDAPALAQADVGVSMNTGTQASREAGNMVDLDSNPTKLIEVVGIGKQIIMMRGILSLVSLESDIAKYCAVLPLLLGGIYAESPLNWMRLHSVESALLSALIFNLLLIIAMMPLAFKGVDYRPQAAGLLLRNHLLFYGLGGLVLSFVGMKVIDLLIVAGGLIS